MRYLLYRLGDNNGRDDGIGSGEREHGKGGDLDGNHVLRWVVVKEAGREWRDERV